MPKVFTRFQLVEFGNYLLSNDRRETYQKEGDQSVLEERLSVVNHADVENYITSLEAESKTISLDVPRRIRLDLNEPAEVAIYNAIQEVEKMPADVRLTDAVILLSKAKDCVSDFIDSLKQKP